MRLSRAIILLSLVVSLLVALDICCGGAGFGLPEKIIFLKLRLPRVLTALLSGASLSLADPHIMGVSAGSGTGAAIATLLVGTSLPGALSGLTVVTAAFVGAILTSSFVALVSSRVKSTMTVLIFGVMLGFVFSALTSILEYSANAESLKVFYSWSAGSFVGTGYNGILIILSAIL